jgi:hypothetical protein
MRFGFWDLVRWAAVVGVIGYVVMDPQGAASTVHTAVYACKDCVAAVVTFARTLFS